PMKLGRELCYRVLRREPEVAGSFVTIEGADAGLREAFRRARDFFRHDRNPRLLSPIFVDEAKGVGVFHSPDARRGDLFYRRAQRGTIRFPRGAALTFAHDGRLHDLPIDSDRDRRDVKACAPVVAEVARALPSPVLASLVTRLRAHWAEGNTVLSVLLREL